MRLAAARSSRTARSTRHRPPENSTNACASVTHVPQASGIPTAVHAKAARMPNAAARPGLGTRDSGLDLGIWGLGFGIWGLTRALATNPRTSNPESTYIVTS